MDFNTELDIATAKFIENYRELKNGKVRKESSAVFGEKVRAGIIFGKNGEKTNVHFYCSPGFVEFL